MPVCSSPSAIPLIAVNILEGYADRGGGRAGLAVAALWIVVAAGAICVERRRQFRR